MDHTHDAESDDDLDARLAKVFEERGIPNPLPRPALRPLPPPPVAKVDAPAPVAKVDAPAPVAKLDAPAPRPQAVSQAPPRPAPMAGKPAPPPVAPRRSSRREKTILLAMLGTLAAGRYSRRPASDRLTPIAATDLAPIPADAAFPASRLAGNSPLRALDEESPPTRRPAFAGAPDRSDPRQGVVPTAAIRPLDPRSAREDAAAPSAGGGYVVREGDTWWSVAESTYGDGRLYKALFAWNRTLDPRVSLAPGTRLELPREEQLRAAWGRLVP